jgi:competence ComEA-like helix-hairpin-helix protein
MTDRIRIFILVIIMTLFIGYRYFSLNKQDRSQNEPIIETRVHNLSNPKFINIPDFNKRENDVELIEFRSFPEKLNINKERKEVLEILPLVGSKRSEEIVKYREEHGNFKTIDDLLQVPTMNQTVIDAIKEYIIFSDEGCLKTPQ